MPDTRWGATPDEWAHFDLILGLGEDLLPCVSNPHAPIAPKSALRDLGKVPSILNANGEAVGLANWTERRASDVALARWAAQPDYGICLQTREVRALDIDIPDPKMCSVVLASLCERFPWFSFLPMRFRTDSPKCLFLFRMPGKFSKSIIRLPDESIIEFLANGQQCVLIGTHPDGERYLWKDGLPGNIPEVSEEMFGKLWSFLAEKYEGESKAIAAKADRRTDANLVKKDPLLSRLDILAWGEDGRAFIRCPFEDQHTTPTGPKDTVYFPAGTRGYSEGHFKCLHAHCEGKTDGDFVNALNLLEEDFSIVEEEKRAPLPKFSRNKKGQIYPTLDNLEKALDNPDVCGVRISRDLFRDELMKAPAGTDQWTPFTDEDYTSLRLYLEKNSFAEIAADKLKDMVRLMGQRSSFDSAKLWLDSLSWDGVPRIETFYPSYFGTDDDPYTRAVGKYLWTALAGRIDEPGVKADMVPVLEGRQSIGKTRSIYALVPDDTLVTNISFGEREETISRKVRGRLVVELDELRGLRTKEAEAIKSWVTRQYEQWVPKYREFTTTYPRRFVCVGTTNETDFLSDETGNRRWLPVHVRRADVDRIRADRDQLWAEAVQAFRESGVDWTAEKLSEPAHRAYQYEDPWETRVADWLVEKGLDGVRPADMDCLAAGFILTDALGVPPSQQRMLETKRLSQVMTALGFERVRIREQGRNVRAWQKKGA